MPDDLTAQMAAFDRAVLNRDHAVAESVLDDDYQLQLVQPSAAAMPRARWLEVLPDYVVSEYEIQEQRVDIDGDVAVVLSRVRMNADVLGHDRSGVFVITDVWRQRNGVWRVWRRHSTPATAGDLPGK
jgi:ketosteroid isomerase-like protein